MPGLTLVALYLAFLVAVAMSEPGSRAADPARSGGAARPGAASRQVGKALVAPVLLIMVVLGSILIGLATPTEAAAVGAVGAMLLAARASKAPHARRARYVLRGC